MVVIATPAWSSKGVSLMVQRDAALQYDLHNKSVTKSILPNLGHPGPFRCETALTVATHCHTQANQKHVTQPLHFVYAPHLAHSDS